MVNLGLLESLPNSMEVFSTNNCELFLFKISCKSFVVSICNSRHVSLVTVVVRWTADQEVPASNPTPWPNVNFTEHKK